MISQAIKVQITVPHVFLIANAFCEVLSAMPVLKSSGQAKRRDTLLAAMFLLLGAIAKGSANAAPYLGATLTFWQVIAAEYE